MTIDPDLRQRLRLLIAAAAKVSPALIEDHTDLAGLGLRSMDLVGLVIEIESVFEVEIPEQALTAGNFASLDGLAALLAQARG